MHTASETQSQEMRPGRYLARIVEARLEPWGTFPCTVDVWSLVWEITDGRFAGVRIGQVEDLNEPASTRSLGRIHHFIDHRKCRKLADIVGTVCAITIGATPKSGGDLQVTLIDHPAMYGNRVLG